MTTGSVLKVLIYVYDHYMLADREQIPERRDMLADLKKRGFSVSEVVHAMEWLSALVGDQRAAPPTGDEPERAGLRIFADGELSRLSSDCRAFLMLLDRQRVLTTRQRELVIDRALALDVDEVDVEQLKWVVLLVLSAQPGQELAFDRFESVVSAAERPLRH